MEKPIGAGERTGIMVLCRRKDCENHMKANSFTDGYGLCLAVYGRLRIKNGVNGPMCETYRSREEAVSKRNGAASGRSEAKGDGA